jgi:hypothetical protein
MGYLTGIFPWIRPLFIGFKSLFTDHSKTSESVTKSVAEISETMAGPERDNLDPERVRAFAELVRSMTPYAVVEWLFYATKLLGLLAIMTYFLSTLRRDIEGSRKKK